MFIPLEQIKPKYIPFKCVVCNGWGTVSNKRVTCHACDGKGYLEVPEQIERESEYGEPK